ncbi:MAG: ABC transporter permease [Proteobacteria bacterium]|nr:ABC transporter permease [Pseudomonadota bacterium]
MTAYYMRLALKSFQRNLGLTALMVGAIALGIAVCVMTMTVFHAMSGNPIWWKGDRLYAVTMDNWDPNDVYDPLHPELAPPMLTYKDAKFLSQSNIPERKVMMYKVNSIVTGGTAERRPHHVISRATTADFFAMFEVPFEYGSGWSAAADEGPQPVIVISQKENQTLFGGGNSVGRNIIWNNTQFRIIGVLKDWSPQPKFYDLNNGPFDVPEDAYVPLGWGPNLELLSAGSSNCWKPEPLDSFPEYMSSDCTWIEMWVELPNAKARERFQNFMDGYWSDQHAAGRFPRPRRNQLTPVGQWLIDQGVVQNDNRVLVGLSFAFLAVCLINTIGLLLAKFLNGAAITGVRRALGASRREVFKQHLVEVGVLASIGALLGLGLSAVGLWLVHALYASVRFGERGGFQELTHFDTTSVIWAVILAVIATLAAGLYPAWRIGRLPPAVYLKSQ